MVHKDGFQAWKLKKLSLNVWREKKKKKKRKESAKYWVLILELLIHYHTRLEM